MSIAVYPPGPASAGIVMQANGSLPVIPLYLPVPPVMRWVPQFICGCDLSTSRVSNVEKIWSPSASVNTQAPSMYFLSPDATLSAAHRADILSSIFSPFHVLGGPDRLKIGGRSKAGNVNAHQRPENEVRHVGRRSLLFHWLRHHRPGDEVHRGTKGGSCNH